MIDPLIRLALSEATKHLKKKAKEKRVEQSKPRTQNLLLDHVNGENALLIADHHIRYTLKYLHDNFPGKRANEFNEVASNFLNAIARVRAHLADSRNAKIAHKCFLSFEGPMTSCNSYTLTIKKGGKEDKPIMSAFIGDLLHPGT